MNIPYYCPVGINDIENQVFVLRKHMMNLAYSGDYNQENFNFVNESKEEYVVLNVYGYGWCSVERK